jgi:hypothetical protein
MEDDSNGRGRISMPVAARVVLSVTLASVVFCCCIGFLASGEATPPASNAYRLLYGAIGVLCALWIVSLWIARARIALGKDLNLS